MTTKQLINGLKRLNSNTEDSEYEFFITAAINYIQTNEEQKQ